MEKKSTIYLREYMESQRTSLPARASGVGAGHVLAVLKHQSLSPESPCPGLAHTRKGPCFSAFAYCHDTLSNVVIHFSSQE